MRSERHEPDSPRLRGLDHDAIALRGRDGFVDADCAPFEVDVVPSKCAYLTPPRPCRDRDLQPAPEREVLRVRGGEHGSHVVDRRRTDRGARDLRSLSRGDGVAGEPTPTNRLRDSSVQDNVRTADTRMAKTIGGELGVQLVAVAGGESCDSDLAEAWFEVAADDALPVLARLRRQGRGGHELIEQLADGRTLAPLKAGARLNNQALQRLDGVRSSAADGLR